MLHCSLKFSESRLFNFSHFRVIVFTDTRMDRHTQTYTDRHTGELCSCDHELPPNTDLGLHFMATELYLCIIYYELDLIVPVTVET